MNFIAAKRALKRDELVQRPSWSADEVLGIIQVDTPLGGAVSLVRVRPRFRGNKRDARTLTRSLTLEDANAVDWRKVSKATADAPQAAQRRRLRDG